MLLIARTTSRNRTEVEKKSKNPLTPVMMLTKEAKTTQVVPCLYAYDLLDVG